ncbi:hypothetical protein BDZ85DRAFT_272644 [Elsinoe ampelina]|uniref:Uncharacterized protein n=1 Tax=Elsinoe ampelina TaxID=302913 RepID=A0A6A6GKC7_9PEZI|nr:hypothetical protein BDZ85DRAFT_272644 [Elsinoe ampelina]
MPLQLLPASAAAFAPRAAPNIVLGTGKIEPWLTQSIKRCLKAKRVLHNPKQHERCLNELLGGENAIWTLTSLLLPKAPETELRKDDNPLVEAISNYNMLHVQAYIVHVDMVSQNEVAYKLTKESIDALVEYHRDVYSVDAADSLFSWPEKDAQVKKMQEEFVQATNRFVFRTNVHALEGLEEEGAGELLDGRAEDVKRAIMNLFAPLLPPPPTIVDVVIPAPSYVAQQAPNTWWQQATYLPAQSMSMPNDSWQPMLTSSPSPSMTNCSDPHSQWWPSVSVEPVMESLHQQSPTPSLTQNDYSSCDSSVYSSPEPMPLVSEYPFPSQLPQSCGSNMGFNDFSVMGWDLNTWAPQYAATM